MINHNLTGIPKTLMIPRSRANETSSPNPIIRDEHAVEMVKQIDYDFSQFDREWMTQLFVVIRTEILDGSVKDFIDRHPAALIVNLGCGLDTRFFRVDNGKTRWYDLDLPELIRINKLFFEETDRYKMIP